MTRLVIFDLDGTIYRGEAPVEHASFAVRALLDAGIEVRYSTNNSAAIAEKVCGKLTRMSIPCREEWVYGTGPETAAYCTSLGCSRVYVVGEAALDEAFLAAGFSGSPPLLHRDGDGKAAVVAGVCRRLTYDLMDGALQELLNGAHFIGTNEDAVYPLEGGRVQPGAGATVAYLAKCAGRQPDVVIGKPSGRMTRRICADAGVPLEQAMMVGDREDTDIEEGRRAGCPTWMVLTGVTASLPAGQAGSQDLRGLVAHLLGP